MNSRQWLAVWGFNNPGASLKTTIQLVGALPKAAVRLAVKMPLALFPRPVRPAL